MTGNVMGERKELGNRTESFGAADFRFYPIDCKELSRA